MKSGRWLFFLLLLGRNWLCVCAAAEGFQKRTEAMERMQHQQVQVKESRCAEEIPQRWKQPIGEDRAEMKKETKNTEVHFAEWFSVDKRQEVHEKAQRKVRDLIFGIEHRLRKEEMEEQSIKEAKEGWRFVADAARIIDEAAGSEGRKHCHIAP